MNDQCNVAWESKLRSVVWSGNCGRIHAKENAWQSGERSCIMPGLPNHLVQELNASIVVVFTFLQLTKLVGVQKGCTEEDRKITMRVGFMEWISKALVLLS